MLFLHISISSVRMMDTYIKMIRDNFPQEEHRFLYWDDLAPDDRCLLDYGNSVELLGDEKTRADLARAEMERADVVIWHGLLSGAKRFLIPLLNKRIMDKSMWIIHGIDLYNWKIEEFGPRSAAINLLNYLTRKGMPKVGLIFQGDEQAYRERFGKRARTFYLPYPIAEDSFDTMEAYRCAPPRANGKLYVQVAHNAHIFNNHEKILDSIAHFSDENIRVIIPLSYGTVWYNEQQGYVNTIRNKAAAIFGDKAVCLKRLMPRDEYSKLLCNIDISVYQSDRQNALGNLLKSLYTGNKVFLSPRSPLYKFFVSKGIEIGNSDEISSMTFEQFSAPANSEAAVRWIRENHYPDAVAYYWKAFFDSCKGITMTDSEIRDGVRRAVDAAFSSERVTERKGKLNHFDLTRYVQLPKGSKLAEIQTARIVGATHLGIGLCEEMLEENKEKAVWAVEGLYDDEVTTACITGDTCDVIGRIDDVEPLPDAHYFIAYEDPEERERVADRVTGKGCTLGVYCASEATVRPRAVLEPGAMILGQSVIGWYSEIGQCAMISDSYLGQEVQVGAYSTIESRCEIGRNAVIGSHAVISTGVRIWPGVHIPDGAVIPPFTEVKTDIE